MANIGSGWAFGELRELQDKCGTGPFMVYQRLADGTWRVDDVREPLRLGLIGGGMNPTMALGKVGRYVTPGTFLENVMAARRVMLAALFGDPADDVVGKAQAAAETAANLNGITIQPIHRHRRSHRMVRRPTQPSAAYGNSPPPSMAGTDATAQAKANGPTP